jgi:hypothetical protein
MSRRDTACAADQPRSRAAAAPGPADPQQLALLRATRDWAVGELELRDAASRNSQWASVAGCYARAGLLARLRPAALRGADSLVDRAALGAATGVVLGVSRCEGCLRVGEWTAGAGGE